ncbi:MAG: GIY-YIG nuclease family protein [Armatimonadetes bacterium]|nr:GIY-YIG nuclease family protein [Armatimonadota bacterium]
MFFVYILHSASSDRFYVGHTSNLDDRLARHNQGRSKSTKSGVPWTLVYHEQFESRAEAVRRESEIKSWKSRKRIEELING